MSNLSDMDASSDLRRSSSSSTATVNYLLPAIGQLKEETNLVIHYLNQNHLGVSEYEKAQRELRQFNRPLIGIVGQDSDSFSYNEYQKKILGSAY